uniref:Uncharacterized protein n=1 Tax=Chenopodium quinoa TaxID=63459 RepID=A0A803N7V5_CHEQI
MNHSMIPSFCYSEFNPQIVNVAEKRSQITQKAQDSDVYYSFLKSSELMIINFYRISQIDDDNSTKLFIFEMVAAASSNNNAIESSKDMMVSWIIFDYTTANFDDCCSRNSIGLAKKMGANSILDEIGSFGALASLVPMRVKVENYVISVRKTADVAPENGNLPGYQNANGNGNTGYDNGVPESQPNAGNNNGAAAANNRNVGGHDNENINNGYLVERHRLKIYEYDANSELKLVHNTNVVADDFDSWSEFAGVVYQYWLTVAGLVNAEQLAEAAIVPTPPDHCWPGSRTVFGNVDGGQNFTELNWFFLARENSLELRCSNAISPMIMTAILLSDQGYRYG